MPDPFSNFFTRSAPRFRVPHPPLGDRWFLVIHAAVAEAFVRIRSEGIDLSTAGENEITNHLEDFLRNDLLNRGAVDGFDKDFFAGVTRGSEVVNYSGLKISKKPDLIFQLQRESGLYDVRQDAVFAECKPVDKDHSLNKNYCAFGTDRVGIERFVIGDYAWAMQEALMIGYVREGLLINLHLSRSLADTKRNSRLGSPKAPVSLPESLTSAITQPLHKTHHARDFIWKENAQAATPIAVFHSWHDCS